jgi:hypothetical protein
MPQIEGVWNANMQVCGADKVRMQMNCEGTRVANRASGSAEMSI